MTSQFIKRKAVVVLVILGSAALAGLIHLILDGSLDKRKCECQLKCIGCAIELYREDNGGLYPPSLVAIENGTLRPLLRCPGSHNHKFDKRDGPDSNSDYIYVDWSAQSIVASNTLPAKYPLVYDARISNHKGRGVNVLLNDGFVMWDEGISWLTRFSLDHGGISLPR